MKKAFTLVELLVVIGIIAILVGSLSISLGSGRESARAAKCLANMKNLATAVHSAAMSSGWYPRASSSEYVYMNDSNLNDVHASYGEYRGWISWYSDGAYRGDVRNPVASGSWFTSAYDQRREAREYCITNGALFAAIGRSREAFVCPQHVRKFNKTPPAWSYVMNAFFGFDSSLGSKSFGGTHHQKYTELSKADRRLLFAELPFAGYVPGENVDPDSATGPNNDCTLHYDGSKGELGKEYIGFNHARGKHVYAHVAFADGHTEKIELGKADKNAIIELTKWLCEGKDVTYDAASGRWKEL